MVEAFCGKGQLLPLWEVGVRGPSAVWVPVPHVTNVKSVLIYPGPAHSRICCMPFHYTYVACMDRVPTPFFTASLITIECCAVLSIREYGGHK